MVDIEIELDGENYRPGEKVTGKVLISTKEVTEIEEVLLEFSGREHTKIVVGSGDDRRTYREEREYFFFEEQLSQKTFLNPGVTQEEFEFVIPKALHGSYDGHHGKIEYSLKGKVGRSWRLDPSCERQILVTWGIPRTPPRPNKVDEVLMDDEEILLRLEAPTDVLSLGEDYNFRLWLDSDVSAREVRARLIYREDAVADGHTHKNRDLLSEWYMSGDELPRDMWIAAEVRTERRWPIPFTTELIRTLYYLKITIDVPWRFDKNLLIPLRCHIPQINEPDLEEDDFFDVQF